MVLLALMSVQVGTVALLVGLLLVIDTAVVELVVVLVVDTEVGIEVDIVAAEVDCSMLEIVLEEERIVVVVVHMCFLVADTVVDKLVVWLD